MIVYRLPAWLLFATQVALVRVSRKWYNSSRLCKDLKASNSLSSASVSLVCECFGASLYVKKRESKKACVYVYACTWVCVTLCLCKWEWKREKEYEQERDCVLSGETTVRQFMFKQSRVTYIRFGGNGIKVLQALISTVPRCCNNNWEGRIISVFMKRRISFTASEYCCCWNPHDRDGGVWSLSVFDF